MKSATYTLANLSTPQSRTRFSTLLIQTPTPLPYPTDQAARLVILGEQIAPQDLGSEKWWPTAPTPMVRSKLLRRISREGYVLPNLVAIGLALLAEMYTTTSTQLRTNPSLSDPNSTSTRRTRLQYLSSPIADFGIAKGRAVVKNQDKLAYLSLSECSHPQFEKGQDPDDHYWLYFTTMRGEEVTLDCGMFTFNFCLIVPTSPYSQVLTRLVGMDILPQYIPAHFRDRDQARMAPRVQEAKHRFSFLRHEPLHSAVADPAENAAVILEYMETIAGRECDGVEKKLAIQWAVHDCQAMELLIKERGWTSWPKEPSMNIERDPGEGSYSVSKDEEAWFKFVKKWNKKHNKGDLSPEALADAFRAWEKKNRTKVQK